MTDAPEGSPPTASPPPAKRRRGLFRRAEIQAEFQARAHALEEDFKAQVAATRAQIDATNVKIEARTGRNLPLAILIGVALAFAFIASLIFEKAIFMVFAAVLMGFTVFELASALRFAGRDVPRWPSVVAAIATIPVAFYLGDVRWWLAILGAIIGVAVWRIAELIRPSHRSGARELWADVAAGTFVQIYVSFLAGFTVLLTAKHGGEWWVLASLVLVVLVDIGAYVFGLNFGKHKMAPRISPKKTWEGFAGSVIVAVVGGILLSIFVLHEPWWFGFIIGAVIVFTATIGDLTESLIKRDLGIKDISTWLPGHGGFLDRLDSILPSAVAAYILFLIFA